MDEFDDNILTTLKILIIGESFVGKSRFESIIYVFILNFYRFY
jgi:hypothetical protein